MKKQEEKQNLGLAGEYRVMSELRRRNIRAILTTGNAKAVDIYILTGKKECKKIEVKTTDAKKFVTGYFQKYGTEMEVKPDFWVLVYLDRESPAKDRIFVLKNSELEKLQLEVNNGGKPKKGVDNIPIKLLDRYKKCENNWSILK